MFLKLTNYVNINRTQRLVDYMSNWYLTAKSLL